MKLHEIATLLEGRVVTGNDRLAGEITYGFSSDLMSDVLTLDKEQIVLITGLANIQAVRTAEVSNIRCIILVRNKKCTPDMIRAAEESGIVIMEFNGSMFKAAGILSRAGILPIY